MKKLLIIMTKLDAGGAERSLINFLNSYDVSQYEVDLLLFKKEGALLKYVPENVNLLDQDRSLFYMYNFKSKGSFPKGLYYTFLRVVSTFYYKKIKNLDRPTAEQQRWESTYRKAIDGMDEHYDCAMAYLEGEPIYYLVDKVNADRKIGWIHNDYEKISGDRSFDEKYFEKLNYLVTVSDKCVEVLKKNFPDMSGKIVEIPNINSAKIIKKLAEEFYPDEYTQMDRDGDKKEYKIISVGRLTAQKAFDRIIPVSRALLGKGISFKWFVLGDGELRRELDAKISDEGLSDTVKLLGVRNNPYPYIAKADVVVQTSLFEGKSVVLDEAKILHKRIVTTKYDTVMDQAGDYPIEVVEYEPEEMAEAIKRALFGDFEISDEVKLDNIEKIEEYYKVINE